MSDVVRAGSKVRIIGIHNTERLFGTTPTMHQMYESNDPFEVRRITDQSGCRVIHVDEDGILTPYTFALDEVCLYDNDFSYCNVEEVFTFNVNELVL